MPKAKVALDSEGVTVVVGTTVGAVVEIAG